MENNNNKKIEDQIISPVEINTFDNSWEKSWAYIKTIVEVVREPILVLDKNFSVMAANESFYKIFQVEPEETENRLVYELGNGQWNIPALRKLLEDILPKNTFFKGFEVSHEFPFIGSKVMILNARQIHTKENPNFPSIILLAIEDITDMMVVAESLVSHTKQMENKILKQTNKLEIRIKKIEKEVDKIRINS